MQSFNRWDQYHSGQLSLPAVVQLDVTKAGVGMAWVATTDGVVGPFATTSEELAVKCVGIAPAGDEQLFVVDDGSEV